MHFLFRKGFFSALGSLISFGMKNDKSELDQWLGPSLSCWLDALHVYLAESRAAKQLSAPEQRKGDCVCVCWGGALEAETLSAGVHAAHSLGGGCLDQAAGFPGDLGGNHRPPAPGPAIRRLGCKGGSKCAGARLPLFLALRGLGQETSRSHLPLAGTSLLKSEPPSRWLLFYFGCGSNSPRPTQSKRLCFRGRRGKFPFSGKEPRRGGRKTLPKSSVPGHVGGEQPPIAVFAFLSWFCFQSF